MLGVTLLCVGRMREDYYTAAFGEYAKRLGAFCKFETAEIGEQKLPEAPSGREVEAALQTEASEIMKRIPKGSYVVALCVEGRGMTSTALAGLLEGRAAAGTSKVCFIVGGSFGLAQSVKDRADLLFSMSQMTFPHHLARVMLAEQIYRAFSINAGARYHK